MRQLYLPRPPYRWQLGLLIQSLPRRLIPGRLQLFRSRSSSLAALRSRSLIQLDMDRPSFSAARWNKSLSSGEIRMSSRTDLVSSLIQTVYRNLLHISRKIPLDYVQTYAVHSSCQSENELWKPRTSPRPRSPAAPAAVGPLDGGRTGTATPAGSAKGPVELPSDSSRSGL